MKTNIKGIRECWHPIGAGVYPWDEDDCHLLGSPCWLRVRAFELPAAGNVDASKGLNVMCDKQPWWRKCRWKRSKTSPDPA